MRSSIYSEDQEILRQMLRRARKEAGLKQQEVAALLDKPQSFVAKYENGERQLNVLELIKLLSALNQRPDDFIMELSDAVAKLGAEPPGGSAP